MAALAWRPVPGEEDKAELRAFMRTVMERLGVETAGQLTNLLAREGLVQPTEARKVHRWVSGESAPNHWATLQLLRLAGMLRD